jgi:CRP/FNR family transcriptional regulator, cyclic AMP receptor protein
MPRSGPAEDTRHWRARGGGCRVDSSLGQRTLLTMSSVLRACQGRPTRTAATGEAVIEEGSPDGVLLVLAAGSVEIVKGDVQITTVADPGSFFGEMSVLLGMPHTATVRALEPSTFHVVDDALGFLHAHPECAFEIARLLARRLHFVNAYLVDLKRQFEGSGDHLSMVDEVLETLVHHQEPAAAAGSERCPDPTVE